MKNKILKKKEKVMEESGRERGKDMATKKSKIKKIDERENENYKRRKKYIIGKRREDF